MGKSNIRELTKRQIRSKILFKLKTQKEEERKRKSKIIKETLFKAQAFKKAKRVMFYISFDGEVDTREMIKEAQKLGKMVAVPICKKNRIIRPGIFQNKAALQKGPYGIYEPVVKKFMDLEDLNLVIVPGIAFDKKGNRLGRGQAYYDCFLKKVPKKTVSIGLAFAFQILPFIPATTHDVSVDKVIFA